eukprot:COSAG02_NODE_18_length_54986_cov_345.599322_52_plen_169_part_00
MPFHSLRHTNTNSRCRCNSSCAMNGVVSDARRCLIGSDCHVVSMSAQCRRRSSPSTVATRFRQQSTWMRPLRIEESLHRAQGRCCWTSWCAILKTIDARLQVITVATKPKSGAEFWCPSFILDLFLVLCTGCTTRTRGNRCKSSGGCRRGERSNIGITAADSRTMSGN